MLMKDKSPSSQRPMWLLLITLRLSSLPGTHQHIIVMCQTIKDSVFFSCFYVSSYIFISASNYKQHRRLLK